MNTMSNPVRVGFAGCGAIAAIHLAGLILLEDSVELTGLADPDSAAASDLADRYHQLTGKPAPMLFDSLDTMLAAANLDVVHVLTPHHTHVELAQKALVAGCHVLLEKPAAISLQKLDELKLAADSASGQLGICLQNRYNFASRMARQLLSENTFGPITSARAFVTWWRDDAYYTQSPWRGRWSTEGGGVLINQAIHTLDLLSWLVGQEAAIIEGSIDNHHLAEVIEVEDTAHLYIKFTDGTTGVFFATNAYPASAETFLEIVCEKAALRLEGTDKLTVLDRQGQVIHQYFPEKQAFDLKLESVFSQLLPSDKSYWGKSHSLLIADFYRKIETGQAFPIDHLEGGKALRMILNVYSQNQAKILSTGGSHVVT